MKYIRTKDGRVFYAKKKSKKDVELANDNLHWEAIPKGCNDYFTLDYEDDEILKEADTIEELCDAFVYAKCDYMTLDEALHEKEWNESDWQQDGLPIHGAIWTDKGLIYVAKMNAEGELELL